MESTVTSHKTLMIPGPPWGNSRTSPVSSHPSSGFTDVHPIPIQRLSSTKALLFYSVSPPRRDWSVFCPTFAHSPSSSISWPPQSMCSTRGRNKLTLSLDNSSSSTASDDTHLNRWSEIVPPKTALTFAALWDPEEGMVTFSGASLLESESLSGMPPHPFDEDDRSQFISVDRDRDMDTMVGENTATLATFQDALKVFLHRPPRESKEQLSCKAKCLQARASSTFDGLDVYSHELKPKRSLQLSCIDRLEMGSTFHTPSAFGRLRLRSDLMLDAYHSENESCAPSRHTNYLRSRFSTTTTSTSTYVDVANGMQSTTKLATCLPPPVTRTAEQTRTECTSAPASCPCTPRRRLRKRRPFGLDPTTSSPNTSGGQNRSGGSSTDARHPPTTTSPPTTPSKGARYNLKFVTLSRRRSSSDSDGWVCIEVTPIIKQRYIPNLEDDD